MLSLVKRYAISSLCVCFASSFFGFAAVAENLEYLPGKKWDVPPVVAPGETNSQPPADAIVLFDGTDTSSWQEGHEWKVANGVITCGKGELVTNQKFGDCQLHIEWSAPTTEGGSSQGMGNSGVYMMEKFEIQVLDSYSTTTYPEGQAGSLYKQTPPMVNVTRKPGEWNTYDIFWTCPEIEDGKVTKPAYITVVHNGVLVVNHFELAGGTYWNQPPTYEGINDRDDDGNLVGSIMLQYHGNPVRYRNIWIRDLNAPTSKPRQAMYWDHDTDKKTPAE